MTKFITLNHGYKTVIDDEDYNKVINHKYSWYLKKDQSGNAYAYSNLDKKTGKKIFLHRFLIDVPDGKFIDHINGDGLDNRRCNLRICSRSENNWNATSKKEWSSSKYKGVYKYKGKNWKKPFVAQIRFNKKLIYLGYFSTGQEAAISYNTAAQTYFGEFARLNII